ncbi:MAG: cellobiose phosphorylase [Lachnospiraceae bacterium]|nr:cellobiose phosphorylase [Lachnospiraceae bacterium]
MDGTFMIERPEDVAGLYFPLVSETGLKSCVTPRLGGDAKIDQNHFLLEPTSIENLNNNRSCRNFWVRWDENLWSASGVSAKQEVDWMEGVEHSRLEAGILYHKIRRENQRLQVASEILSFVPYDGNFEVHQVTIENTDVLAHSMEFVTAIPMYGRSADNLRDHRHVTSLLNRMEIKEQGIWNTPTLSFDERGHQKGDAIYYVEGISEDGAWPTDFCGVLDDFIGCGSLSWPEALVQKSEDIWQKAGAQVDGQEVLGGLHFAQCSLAPGARKTYIITIGIAHDTKEIMKSRSRWNSPKQVEGLLQDTIDHWNAMAPIRIHTAQPQFDFFFTWVGFQPELRRLFGCSFLPHHDYGRGGRGWRDLWQDCLALLLMHPEEVRPLLVANFAGVREDGTNATIIGEGLGNFKADRNGISRVWMDHGMWPWMTMQLYIQQTGDEEILLEEQGYFESDRRGTILEHLILQNVAAYEKRGEHHMLRLLDADWNDALDLAGERGESVAFSNAYAANLISLGEEILHLQEHFPNRGIDAAKGKELIAMGQSLQEEIRAREWLPEGFYNSYYDNDGHPLANGEMMLTGQVFAIMGGTATEEQIASIVTQANQRLLDPSCGGYRLNTDFHEVKMNMGRQFGFAYGEKENGAVFSHMAVMYANALYRRGFGEAGYQALRYLWEQSMDFKRSHIYPGIPEYFGRGGRGLYHYLTGAASWYLLTVVQQMFGVQAAYGKLQVKPQLQEEQFDAKGQAWIRIPWQGQMCRIVIMKSGDITIEQEG